jgi:hypothetical protein
VHALRERDGPAATDVFVTAAFHASWHISSQGMDALEQAGYSPKPLASPGSP